MQFDDENNHRDHDGNDNHADAHDNDESDDLDTESPSGVCYPREYYYQNPDGDNDVDGASDHDDDNDDSDALDAVSSCGVCHPSEEEAGAARQENHADVNGALDCKSRKNRKNKFFFFRDCAGACGLNVALTIKDEQVNT